MKVNFLNVEKVTKSFANNLLLNYVSLGISVGDRIGIVGRNGGGKSTLIKILTGSTTPDSGKVSKSNKAIFGLLNQFEEFDPKLQVSEYILGSLEVHQWASNPQIRSIFSGLLELKRRKFLNEKLCPCLVVKKEESVWQNY